MVGAPMAGGPAIGLLAQGVFSKGKGAEVGRAGSRESVRLWMMRRRNNTHHNYMHTYHIYYIDGSSSYCSVNHFMSTISFGSRS